MQQFSSLIFIVVIMVVMYFMMIRPQRKRQQQHAETLKKLQKGDHVVTIGRLHGVVDSIDETNKTVSLDCSGVYLEFDLNAIANVEQRAVATDSKDQEPQEDSSKDADASDDNKPAK